MNLKVVETLGWYLSERGWGVSLSALTKPPSGSISVLLSFQNRLSFILSVAPADIFDLMFVFTLTPCILNHTPDNIGY